MQQSIQELRRQIIYLEIELDEKQKLLKKLKDKLSIILELQKRDISSQKLK
jgi:uncharacterized protein (UPF0371 family)